MTLHSDNLTITVRPLNNQLLNCSVWPFQQNELDLAPGVERKSASGLIPLTKRHGAEIKTGDTITWNIDHLQMGVGGDTSWGRMVHKEYLIPVKEYRYSYYIKPGRK